MVKALTVEEVAERLQVDPSWVYKKAQKGELRGAKKLGGLWRFSPNIVEELFCSEGKTEQL